MIASGGYNVLVICHYLHGAAFCCQFSTSSFLECMVTVTLRRNIGVVHEDYIQIPLWLAGGYQDTAVRTF